MKDEIKIETGREFELVGIRADMHIDKNYASQSFWKDVVVRFTRNKGSVFGMMMILLILILAIVGPTMNGYTYDNVNLDHQNLAPRVKWLSHFSIFDGAEKGVDRYAALGLSDTYYWFGTDTLGRDLWTRTWEGTRISLFIAFVAVVIDMVIGVSYGLVSGYFGGAVDSFMQRIVEILNGIPTLITVTLLMLVMEPGLKSIILALMLTGWIGMSRVARAQVLKLKEQEYVLAARTLGIGHIDLIAKEILPNIFGQLITMSMFSIPSAIFSEAFLSFVGLGVPTPMASLGSLINDGYKSFLTHPYMLVFPTVVLALLMLSFNLMADGLRDAFDPKMQEL
ncbi:MAG: ABC transporter permease [Clostridia bacterium]|nr:ABC transporter permease [Clostridia bacterium]